MPHGAPPDPNPDEPVDLPISPGTTWTDDEGNTWTAYGSLSIGDDAIQSVRQNLVTFLKGQHPKWQWYTFPPDNLKTPAVAVNPGDPFIEPYAQDGNTVIWAIDLVIIVGRMKPQQALRRLEFMFTEITLSLKEYPSAMWGSLSEIGMTEISSTEYLTATLSVAVVSPLVPLET